MKGRKIFIILGLLIAVFASVLTYRYLESYSQTKTVLVLAQDVEANQPILPEMLIEKELPLAAVPDDAITNRKVVVGKSIRGMIMKDTIIQGSMLIDTNQSRMSGVLLEKGVNFRGIALPLDISTTVGGTLQTGDYVDVYALEKTGATEIMKNIEVVRGTPASIENNSSINKHNLAIILSVPEEYVKSLNDAIARGAKINLSLLPYRD
ncbi:MAG: Flp pilus assembly protein CpaB [Tepidibacillus sp.]